ncbi:MAG: imidazole glycerol phosphate synthase subunit HisH [Nevskiales bacterium]
MATIGVIDYGMGNLHSIAKALEVAAAGQRVEVSYDPDKLRKADRLVLPGVGAIGQCMEELKRLELDQLVRELAGKKPLIGICLGMQVLLGRSEENGGTEALNLIPGEVKRFPGGNGLKVPHMGWNRVHQARQHRLWQDIPQDSWFYFVHSYYAAPNEAAQLFATCEYGPRFAAAVIRDNVVAVQFHPEKSQAAGIALLSNFLQWNGKA